MSSLNLFQTNGHILQTDWFNFKKATWNDIIFSYVYSYGHMEEHKLSFKHFWTSVKLVTIETLEAIQILSTFMNNWHDFPLLNPDIFIFWAEESSFHTTYFG